MNPMPTIAELIRVRDLATADDPSSWPAGFMQSITEQAQKGRSLSASQLHHYAKIAVNYTPEALAEAATWPDIYRRDYRDNAVLVARYYKTTSYFREIASQIVANPDYVPPMRSLKRMVNNKYAQRVLEAYNTPAKYPIGSMVLPRSSASWRLRNIIKRGAVVIRDDLPVISSAKGARMYSLLPIGATKPIDMEERHIKIMRLKK
tara:strand:- start:2969 stop:3583 length:615 start_codon:yes stop_codon:yes gene_type:complete